MQPEQLLEIFRKDLDNLKDNDKYKINGLTIFARDHKDNEKVALGIVDLTIKHVHLIPSGLKLLGLYVIDSIVKNVGVPFRKMYTGSIVDAFVHSFQAIRDEKGRLKLYNLRTTWKDIFPNGRLYELDIRVREHDPAWPLLAAQPESKSTFRSLPTIPKLQVKSEYKEETPMSGSDNSPQTATISESRDPRLNRKRRSPITIDAVTKEEFLIDRSGDQKMEAVARKQGKKEEVIENPKKVSLFGGQDLDMRSQNTPPLSSPTQSGVWSNYIDKHSEVGCRRELKDIDMRVSSSPLHPKRLEPAETGTTVVLSHLPTVVPVDQMSSHNEVSCFSFPASLAPVDSLPPNPADQVATVDPSAGLASALESQLVTSIHGLQRTVIPPLPIHTSAGPSLNRTCPIERLPMTSQHFSQPSRPPVRGPPIRGPVWSVEIYGFPDMVNIGVDPRMLSLVPHPKPPRRITIDGQQYSLLLDRVQPLIMIGDQVHAVRFRCEYATVLINDRCFNIPGTGFTKVMIGWRPYQAYLGGPGHELIIDGRPHTIPLGSQLTYVTVGYHSVGVKFVGDPPRNVNVLPAIPPRLLKWAGQGLFGSPRNLQRAPLNPLTELSRLAEGRVSRAFMTSNIGRPVPPLKCTAAPLTMYPHQNDQSPAVIMSTVPESNTPNSNERPTAVEPVHIPPVTQPSIDVHALFQRLVKAGIVSDTSQTPELTNYNWDRFKLHCQSEIEALYNGHQCSQCGLRFQSDLSPEFATHLDYHYMKNCSDDQDRRSRNFYQSARYWLLSEPTHDGTSQFDPETAVPDLQESKCPAFADPNKNACAVCYEKFDVFWDHDEEEWMLRDAVLVQDKVYHPICQEDAGKEFVTENSVAHDMKEVPLSPSDLKTDPPTNTSTVVSESTSPTDEHAFGCDDPPESTQIPGLSPVSNSASPVMDTEVAVKPEPDVQASVVVKPEHREIVPVHEHISADPLAALKAVLHGGISSLIQPPSSS